MFFSVVATRRYNGNVLHSKVRVGLGIKAEDEKKEKMLIWGLTLSDIASCSLGEGVLGRDGRINLSF